MKLLRCKGCGHQWRAMDEKSERDILKAVEVNKTGPFCYICMYLEMAYRHSILRRVSFRKVALDFMKQKRYERT